MVNKPRKVAEYITEGLFRDSARDEVVLNVQRMISADFQTSKDVRIVIDPVVVNGLWSYVRQQLVTTVLQRMPDHFLTEADELNVKNLLDTVRENQQLLSMYLFGDNDYLINQYNQMDGQMLYREYEVNDSGVSRCLFTGLPLGDGELVDRLELGSKSLFVSRKRHWCDGKLNTLTVFNLLWEQRQFERLILHAIYSNPAYGGGGSGKLLMMINEIARSDELQNFTVALVLRFQLITGTLKEMVKKERPQLIPYK